MKTELYYFTGTGNSLHIAKSIKKNLEKMNQDALLIPINTLKLSNVISSTADRIGIIYPTYGLTAPDLVKSFAKKLQVSNQAYVFLYSHCGKMGADNALYAIQKILNDNGILVSNTYESKFPSNAAMFATTPQQLEDDLKIAEESLQEHSKSIVNQNVRKIATPNTIKNISFSINESFGALADSILQFSNIESNDDCIGCSVCVKVCPMENIKLENQRPTYGNKCEMCLSCVNQCPKKALSYKKMKKEKLISYRHPEVQLKEIMYR